MAVADSAAGNERGGVGPLRLDVRLSSASGLVRLIVVRYHQLIPLPSSRGDAHLNHDGRPAKLGAVQPIGRALRVRLVVERHDRLSTKDWRSRSKGVRRGVLQRDAVDGSERAAEVEERAGSGAVGQALEDARGRRWDGFVAWRRREVEVESAVVVGQEGWVRGSVGLLGCGSGGVS